jgi:hypothetical protein
MRNFLAQLPARAEQSVPIRRRQLPLKGNALVVWRAAPNPADPQGIKPMNDNEPKPVTIITGRVFRNKGGDSEGVHIFLVAPDDDTAVRTALEALAKEGYAEAELDQIGEMDGPPDDEPHMSAYQGALEGEVSIVTFDEPF